MALGGALFALFERMRPSKKHVTIMQRTPRRADPAVAEVV